MDLNTATTVINFRKQFEKIVEAHENFLDKKDLRIVWNDSGNITGYTTICNSLIESKDRDVAQRIASCASIHGLDLHKLIMIYFRGKTWKCFIQITFLITLQTTSIELRVTLSSIKNNLLSSWGR